MNKREQEGENQKKNGYLRVCVFTPEYDTKNKCMPWENYHNLIKK